MGGAQSAPGEDTFGYHVLNVMPNSPAEKAEIEPFFDFILGINETRLMDEDSEELARQLHESKGKPVTLHIYSGKDMTQREVIVVPNNDWGAEVKNSLIGCSIRFCSYQKACENVWHILDVASDSPASIAGLQPHSDFVVGAPRVTLSSEDDFYDLVERHNGQEMRLYVYNTNWDSCREVLIVPNSEWGGQGSLGCDVGYGLLHRIPSRVNRSRKPSMAQLTKHGSITAEESEVAMYAVGTKLSIPYPDVGKSRLDSSEMTIHPTEKDPLKLHGTTADEGLAEYENKTSTTADAIDALDELMKISSNAELPPSSMSSSHPNIPTQESPNSPPGSVELTGVREAPSPPIADERPPWESRAYVKTASEENSASITPATGSSPQKFASSQILSEKSSSGDTSSLLEKLSIEKSTQSVIESPLTAGHAERLEAAPTHEDQFA